MQWFVARGRCPSTEAGVERAAMRAPPRRRRPSHSHRSGCDPTHMPRARWRREAQQAVPEQPSAPHRRPRHSPCGAPPRVPAPGDRLDHQIRVGRAAHSPTQIDGRRRGWREHACHRRRSHVWRHLAAPLDGLLCETSPRRRCCRRCRRGYPKRTRRRRGRGRMWRDGRTLRARPAAARALSRARASRSPRRALAARRDPSPMSTQSRLRSRTPCGRIRMRGRGRDDPAAPQAAVAAAPLRRRRPGRARRMRRRPTCRPRPWRSRRRRGSCPAPRARAVCLQAPPLHVAPSGRHYRRRGPGDRPSRDPRSTYAPSPPCGTTGTRE